MGTNRAVFTVGPRAIFLALAAGIVGYQILVPPVVGLGNSGDFGKIIGLFGLTGRSSTRRSIW
jgi:hypothetical protein